MSIITTILTTLLGILVVGGIGITIYIVNMEKKYRNRAIIKEPGNRGSRVRIDKFKVYRDSDGIEMYRLRKMKRSIPPLPSDCVEIDNKGRLVGTWYLLDDNLVPGKDGYENIDKDELITTTKPFNANQRSMAVNQWKKSERDKPKSWKNIIEQAVPYLVIVILITLMLIFVPDVMQSRAEIDKQADDRVLEITKELTKVSANLDRLVNDRGLIEDDTSSTANADVEVPN